MIDDYKFLEKIRTLLEVDPAFKFKRQGIDLITGEKYLTFNHLPDDTEHKVTVTEIVTSSLLDDGTKNT